MNDRVAALMRQGILRTEAAASHGAPAMLAKAKEFLLAARSEVDASPSVAFSNAYTAARQAVTALMWSEGLRVEGRAREHEGVALYGRAAIPATRELDLAELDRMRRERHAIEYEPGRTATAPRARQACAFVDRLIATIENRLSNAGAS